VLDRNVPLLLCVMWHVFSDVSDHVFFQIILSKVLSCVRFLSAPLLHLLKILQLLVVRVSEL